MVTAEEANDGALYLAYLCAMLTAVALYEHKGQTGLPDSVNILQDQMAQPQERFKKNVPPMLRVFLVTLASVARL
jgi:hypothetical protein